MAIEGESFVIGPPTFNRQKIKSWMVFMCLHTCIARDFTSTCDRRVSKSDKEKRIDHAFFFYFDT